MQCLREGGNHWMVMIGIPLIIGLLIEGWPEAKKQHDIALPCFCSVSKHQLLSLVLLRWTNPLLIHIINPVVEANLILIFSFSLFCSSLNFLTVFIASVLPLSMLMKIIHLLLYWNRSLPNVCLLSRNQMATYLLPRQGTPFSCLHNIWSIFLA